MRINNQDMCVVVKLREYWESTKSEDMDKDFISLNICLFGPFKIDITWIMYGKAVEILAWIWKQYQKTIKISMYRNNRGS